MTLYVGFRGWYWGYFQPGLLPKYLKNWARDYMKKVTALFFELPELKNPMSSQEKISAGAEKMIDRRGKMKIAKATTATDKLLPGSTSDFSFSPGWNISCSPDVFQSGLRGRISAWAEIFPWNQPLRVNNLPQKTQGMFVVQRQD